MNVPFIWDYGDGWHIHPMIMVGAEANRLRPRLALADEWHIHQQSFG
jgi:hypothetical protein